MSSIALSGPADRTKPHRTAWTRLWRFDAVCNLLFGDVMLFAAGPVQTTLGMLPDTVTPIRIIGAIIAGYSLLQLWFTRQGEPLQWVYQLASLDMVVSGAGFALALLASIQMNPLGVVGTVILSVGSWLLAGLYYTRSRQLS